MTSENICIDCGKDYQYDSDNPKGASSLRCVSCRKKNTKFNNHFSLLEAAGCGIVRCFKCGYQRCIEALGLHDTYEPLKKPVTQEEKLSYAKSQYILCLNCHKEVEIGSVELEIVDKKSSPIKLAFYERNVTIVRHKLDDFQPVISDLEITKDEPRTT